MWKIEIILLAYEVVTGGLMVRVQHSTLGSTFFLFIFNPCITVFGLPYLADNSKYVAAFSLKPVLKVM